MEDGGKRGGGRGGISLREDVAGGYSSLSLLFLFSFFPNRRREEKRKNVARKYVGNSGFFPFLSAVPYGMSFY